jgi:hypothetical protein
MELNIANLTAFVAATSGRRGTVDAVPGGVVVASPVAVANGYVNAAFCTTSAVPATTFLARSRSFFDGISHPHVVWIPTGDADLLAAAVAAGGTSDDPDTPAMSRATPVGTVTALQVREVESEEEQVDVRATVRGETHSLVWHGSSTTTAATTFPEPYGSSPLTTPATGGSDAATATARPPASTTSPPHRSIMDGARRLPSRRGSWTPVW